MGSAGLTAAETAPPDRTEAESQPPEPAARNWPAAGRAVLLAIALSVVLAVVAIIDQTGHRSLADHVTATYAPYGKRPDPNLTYGLLYIVATAGVLAIALLRSRRAHRGTES